jgi:hypothetical protein
MVMSILLFQQKTHKAAGTRTAGDHASNLKQPTFQKAMKQAVPLESKPESSVQAVPNGGEQRRLF